MDWKNSGLDNWRFCIMPGAYDVDYQYNDKTELPAGASTSLLITDLVVNQTSDTEVSITFSKLTATVQPTTVEISVQRLLSDGSNDGSVNLIIETIENPNEEILFTVGSLTPERRYKFTVQAKRSAAYGNLLSTQVELSSSEFNGKVIGHQLDPKNIGQGKPYLTISNTTKQKDHFAVSSREFPAITIPAQTSAILTGTYSVDQAMRNNSESYFSFGTTVFMESVENAATGSGIGFFVNEEATSGYFLIVESTSLSSSQDRKAIRIVKTNGTKIKVLVDSQKTTSSTFGGVFGATSYTLDIKVKVKNLAVEIIAYINGFKLVATDTTTGSGLKEIIHPTKRVALLSTQGTSAFDYVYGTDINKDVYDDAGNKGNFYYGQFSNDIIDVAFGETIYNASLEDDEYEKKKTMVDEFGTVVREIINTKIKFDSRPAFPVKWTTGGNPYAKILASKVSNFSAEAYVLNNTSTTIPLSDNENSYFYVFGNTLGMSGELDYTTEEVSDYTSKEPIQFQSMWLQNLSDVKSLADWIKNTVVNRGKVVSMEVFGNPLISVGDIVTVKYSYQGFVGTEKLIVTGVTHRYNSGLETSINCRTL
jgi:hypothetical protein